MASAVVDIGSGDGMREFSELLVAKKVEELEDRIVEQALTALNLTIDTNLGTSSCSTPLRVFRPLMDASGKLDTRRRSADAFYSALSHLFIANSNSFLDEVEIQKLEVLLSYGTEGSWHFNMMGVDDSRVDSHFENLLNSPGCCGVTVATLSSLFLGDEVGQSLVKANGAGRKAALAARNETLYKNRELMSSPKGKELFREILKRSGITAELSSYLTEKGFPSSVTRLLDIANGDGSISPFLSSLEPTLSKEEVSFVKEKLNSIRKTSADIRKKEVQLAKKLGTEFDEQELISKDGHLYGAGLSSLKKALEQAALADEPSIGVIQLDDTHIYILEVVPTPEGTEIYMHGSWFGHYNYSQSALAGDRKCKIDINEHIDTLAALMNAKLSLEDRAAELNSKFLPEPVFPSMMERGLDFTPEDVKPMEGGIVSFSFTNYDPYSINENYRRLSESRAGSPFAMIEEFTPRQQRAIRSLLAPLSRVNSLSPSSRWSSSSSEASSPDSVLRLDAIESLKEKPVALSAVALMLEDEDG